jgi:hypothetical protein
MARKRTPSPEALARQGVHVPKPKRSPVTFRLTEDDEDALHALAERAELGPSTFARRIVEHYIQEHARSVTVKRS